MIPAFILSDLDNLRSGFVIAKTGKIVPAVADFKHAIKASGNESDFGVIEGVRLSLYLTPE